MDLFSYILILTSVIYALAVAQILDGVSRLVQCRHPVQTFVPHTIWIVNLFIFIFLVWWASWEFREIEWTRRLFFGAYFFGSFAVIVDGNVLSNETLWHSGRIAHIVILGAAISGFLNESKRVHLALSAMTLLAISGVALTRFLVPR